MNLWAPGHFELGFFCFSDRRSEVGCAALGFFYVVNLKMDNSFEWVLFIVSSQITSDAPWK